MDYFFNVSNNNNIYIYLLVWLGVRLSVCLYPINVKIAEPTGLKFFSGTSHDPGNGYR